MKKGDIYLVDFGKNRDSFESGKLRPVVIFQMARLTKDEIHEVENVLKDVFEIL